MQRTKVKSSLLASVGYDPATQVLEVEFLARQKEPTRRIYQYAGVTPEQFKEMVSDKSLGGYFLARIKPNHQCTRIEEKVDVASEAPGN